jgi:hypothetical protein
MKTMNRRQFLRLAGATAAGVTLFGAGCVTQRTTSALTTAPEQTSVPAATLPVADAPVPTFTPTLITEVRWPEIIKFYPDMPSRVVRASHANAWDGEVLAPEAPRQMLDAAITALTGLSDADEAWAALFSPGERIAIKVNTIRNSLFWTHVPLVMAVAECLQEVGIPAEQIVVFDRDTAELEEAGYPINRDGRGVRCYGTDGAYTGGWTVAQSAVCLSDILLGCDALINVPLLKSHALSGITFAMKNHYGIFDQPQNFHSSDRMVRGIVELGALPEIRDRQRLIVGDALLSTLKEASSWPYWRDAIPGNSIFMSFDPVAHDTVGLQHWCQLKTEHGESTEAPTHLANTWLQRGADLGLGTNTLENVDLVEVNLG